MLTQEKLKEFLDYNKKTGVFTWKKSRGSAKKGKGAGCIDGGYRRIKIDSVSYWSHRLAWLYIHGYFPENEIDHIDRNKLNNKIINLREVSSQCNLRNSKVSSSNKSGIKGVRWDKHRKIYYADIRVNNKTYYLGSYEDFSEVVCHRLAAEQCLNWSGCDSNSSAFQYVKKIIETKVLK